MNLIRAITRPPGKFRVVHCQHFIYNVSFSDNLVRRIYWWWGSQEEALYLPMSVRLFVCFAYRYECAFSCVYLTFRVYLTLRVRMCALNLACVLDFECVYLTLCLCT